MTVHSKPEKGAIPVGRAETKIVRVGNSLGMILSKEMLARMKVDQGDRLFIVETADGFILTPYDPTIADQVKRGQAFMKKYRDTFRALAQ